MTIHILQLHSANEGRICFIHYIFNTSHLTSKIAVKFWQGCDPYQFDGERVRWCHAWAFVDSLRGKNLKLLFWFCRVSACYLFIHEYAQSCRRMAPKVKDDSQFCSPTFVGARWPLAGHYFSSKTLQRHMCVSLSTLDIHLFLSHSHVLYLGLTWSARGPISE